MEGNKNNDLSRAGKPLAGVDANTTDEFIRDRYDQWANRYDQDMISYSYVAPTAAVKVLNQYAEEHGINKDSKVMDMGAGTGVIGQLLQKDGYTSIDGVDISSEMLNVARSKNCYKELICSGIGNNAFSKAVDQYDVLFCIGCLTLGHIKPSGVNEMFDMVRIGGLFIFTVRCDAADGNEYGYKQTINQLVTQQKMKMIFKEKIDYLAATANQDPARYCYLFGFVRIK